MSREYNNKFKIDPTIISLNSESAYKNYGQAIAQAFTDLGQIANNQHLIKAQNIKNQYDEINLQKIKDEVEDDRSFANAIMSDNPKEYLKNNKFKTSKYQLLGEEYTNKLSEKQKDMHYKYALNNFANENGKLDLIGAKNHLLSKFNSKEIDENELWDITEALNQKVEEKNKKDLEKQRMQVDINKGYTDINKTRAEIDRINAETKKTEKETEFIGIEENRLTTLERKEKYINNETFKFIDNLKNSGLEFENLATLDTRKLNSTQTIEAQRIAKLHLAELNPSIANRVAKEMQDLGTMQSQLKDSLDMTFKYLNNGKDINLVDKVYREYLGKYLGLSDRQLEIALRDSRYQDTMNTALKIASGTAVSKNEWDRNKQVFGTLYQTNEVLLNGIKNFAKDQYAKMQTMSASMGDVAFNLLYGKTYSNVKDMLEDIENAEKGGLKEEQQIIYKPGEKIENKEERKIIKADELDKFGIKVGY